MCSFPCFERNFGLISNIFSRLNRVDYQTSHFSTRDFLFSSKKVISLHLLKKHLFKKKPPETLL
ncbi:MAG: hypothetical protein CK425_06005 [Parachlamydia sp.]|nr:MAG: hypothetical protein CK425_06005 [Parachlamydia sp.]